MTKDPTIRRGVRNAGYSTVPNRILEDHRLSMEARWLLAYLLSKPDNWTVVVKDICNRGGCGRDKARRMLAELVDIGYAEREQQREGGKFSSSDLVIFDEPTVPLSVAGAEAGRSVANLPQTDSPAPVNPSTVLPAPVNPLHSNNSDIRITESEEERRAGARDRRGQMPADLVKRVQRFCTGEGYRGGLWKGWTSSTVAYIARAFADLSAEDQAIACHHRDAFLAQCRRDGVVPMPVAHYFRDRVWEMLSRQPDPEAGTAHSDEPIEVAPYGAVFGAVRMLAFLDGPVDVQLPPNVREMVSGTYEAHARTRPQTAARYAEERGLTVSPEGQLVFPDNFDEQELIRRRVAQGFPEVVRLHAAARGRRRVEVPGACDALKQLCEAVPVGSAVWWAWRDFHDEHGWEWVPDPGDHPVVWFPKGGPGGLHSFERAARALLAKNHSNSEV